MAQDLFALPALGEENEAQDSRAAEVMVRLWDTAEQEIATQRQPRSIARPVIPAEETPSVRYDRD